MNKLTLLCIAVIMTGCASDPVEKYVELQKDMQEKAVSDAEAKLDSVPEWYLNPPKNDGMGIVGVGAASSKDMHHALKKARLQAEFELAKNYRQELSGSERIYERENGMGTLVQTSQFLIDKLVDSVPIVGYDMIDQKIQVLPDGQFQAYSLLKLPYDEFNKVLQSMKLDSQDTRESEAFNDLERRLEAKRNRKAKDDDRDHERKLELMQQQNMILSDVTVPVAQATQSSTVPVETPKADIKSALLDMVN
ncbi:hypothetical protein GCM10009347_10480 [Shewanella algicola]|uniref:LPP20 family lipoprotein n=1 Tax=Shewanella algicola TaxID=640633 RepID=A0A9X2C9S6_9GAMM|nr:MULTISPECIES: hypothetical protein [Shewanella]MBB1438256.1 hypothetical protein [Shewanella sp. SG41-4]MCL1104515.1 hypothetical protein [Shewanella algicola]GGP44808.1 hypothetical protein GCM10009347_10480 [Shewanella algicola]